MSNSSSATQRNGGFIRARAALLIALVAIAAVASSFAWYRGRQLDRARLQHRAELADKQEQILLGSEIYQAAKADLDQVRAIARRELGDALRAAESSGATTAGAVSVRTEYVEIPLPMECSAVKMEPGSSDPSLPLIPPALPAAPAPAPFEAAAEVHGLIAVDEIGGYYFAGKVFGLFRRGTWSHRQELPIEISDIAVDPALAKSWSDRERPRRSRRELFAGMTSRPAVFVGYSWGRRRLGFVGQVLVDLDRQQEIVGEHQAVDTLDRVELGLGIRWRF